MGVGGGRLHDGKTGGRVVGTHVYGRVDVDPREVEGAADRPELLGGELGSVGAGVGKVRVGVPALLDHGHVGRAQLACRPLGGRDVLGRLDHGNAGQHVLRESDPCPRLPLGSDRLHRQAVAEDRVVAELVEAAGGQLQSRSVDADVVSELDERAELVDREEMLHAIGEVGRDVAGIVREGLRRCPGTPNRPDPGGPAAGPSGRGCRRARSRWRGARPRRGGRSPGPSGSGRRPRPGRPAATPRRSGRRGRPAPS